MRCIFDQGKEFIGYAFQAVLRRHHIEPHPITVRNPQGNSIVERLHQSIANSLRVLAYAHPPKDDLGARIMVETALQTAAYAARATMHTTMKAR